MALLACSVGLTGCQGFTAGEQVSEPDPAQLSAKPTAKNVAHGHDGHGHDGHGHDGHDHPHKEPAAQGEKATASHILIRYVGTLRASADVTRSKAEARAIAEKVVKKAKAGANFGALADEYTEDPSGKGRGGKLSPFGRGAMVPEFDKAVFSMGPGDVSDIVETPFGFHIIHREK